MNLSAIILAGGKSSRMGEDKGLVLLKGKPMVQYLLNLFFELKIPTIIVANNKNYKEFGVPVYADIIKGKGPLSGMYSGLMHSKTDKNIIVSCDIPCLSKEVIECLINNSQNELATVISLDNKLQPLTGIYSKKLKKKILLNIHNENLKLKTFLQSIDFQTIELDNSIIKNVQNNFRNINTKEELNELENGK